LPFSVSLYAENRSGKVISIETVSSIMGQIGKYVYNEALSKLQFCRGSSITKAKLLAYPFNY
jgi:hypothetical protein